MKINLEVATYGDVRSGEAFWSNGELYMKCSNGRAVRIKDGVVRDPDSIDAVQMAYVVVVGDK